MSLLRSLCLAALLHLTSLLAIQQDAVSDLKNKIVPLQSVNAGSGFGDLEPLQSFLQGMHVIGLGEATHGTREFAQCKHRLLEFFVCKMGCRLFAIEASYPECLPINEYVLYGRGDRDAVVAGQGFWCWNTQEMAEMVDWMRSYNQTAPDSEKVQFLGFDCQMSGRAGELLCSLLKQGDPDFYERACMLLASLEDDRAIMNASECADAVAHIAARVDEVSERIKEVSSLWKGTPEEYQEALFLVRLLGQECDMFAVTSESVREKIEQFIEENNLAEFNTEEIRSKFPEFDKLYSAFSRSINCRDAYMAENILALLQRHARQGPMVVWAHDGHVAFDMYDGIVPMGSHLKNALDSSYYALGFSTFSGTFLALDHRTNWQLTTYPLPSQPENSLAHFCHQLGEDKFVLDLRSKPAKRWLDKPCFMLSIGSVFPQDPIPEMYLFEQVPTKFFDGLIYLENTTASRCQ